MPPKAFPREKIIHFLQQHKVLQTSELTKQFGCSKWTIFRIIKDIGYLTSYNRNNSGITLAHIPEFDQNGLWNYRGFYFSRWGTLGKTIEHFVDESRAGVTAGELRKLLHHNNIYHHLTAAVGARQVFRDTKEKKPVYYSNEPQKRREQRKARNKLLQKSDKKRRPERRTDNEGHELTSFDIEKVHFGYLAQLLLSETLTADDIYSMLENMGKPVKRQEITEIIIRHNLDLKKTRIELVGQRTRGKHVASATKT